MRSPAPAPRTIGLLERPWTWREAGRLCARSARCPMEKLWSVISTATAPRISRRARRAAELERLAMHSLASIRFGSAGWIGCASVATSAQRAASSAAVHQVHRGRQREARQQADARGAQRVCRAERVGSNPRRRGLVEARLRFGGSLAASSHCDRHLTIRSIPSSCPDQRPTMRRSDPASPRPALKGDQSIGVCLMTRFRPTRGGIERQDRASLGRIRRS
jgi:hypothetical protein